MTRRQLPQGLLLGLPLVVLCILLCSLSSIESVGHQSKTLLTLFTTSDRPGAPPWPDHQGWQLGAVGHLHSRCQRMSM